MQNDRIFHCRGCLRMQFQPGPFNSKSLQCCFNTSKVTEVIDNKFPLNTGSPDLTWDYYSFPLKQKMNCLWTSLLYYWSLLFSFPTVSHSFPHDSNSNSVVSISGRCEVKPTFPIIVKCLFHSLFHECTESHAEANCGIMKPGVGYRNPVTAEPVMRIQKSDIKEIHENVKQCHSFHSYCFKGYRHFH